MARPKKDTPLNPAQRQAAHRARLAAATVTVDRAAWERLAAKLEALQVAVAAAAARGDSLARRCRAGGVETVLDNIIAAFEEAAGP